MSYSVVGKFAKQKSIEKEKFSNGNDTQDENQYWCGTCQT